ATQPAANPRAPGGVGTPRSAPTMDVDLASCSDAFAGADDTTPLVELSGQRRTIAAIANARMMKASRRVILFCIGSERNVQPVTQLSLRPAQCCIGQACGQRRGRMAFTRNQPPNTGQGWHLPASGRRTLTSRREP